MSKSKKRFDDPRQKSLFDFIKNQASQPTCPGDLNIQIQLKNILSEALKKSTLSRFQVAARMSELLGAEITKTTLDTWTAESKELHRFPAEYLPAFCAATENFLPLELITRKAGAFLFQGPDALRSEIKALEDKCTKLKKEIRKRQTFLKEMEVGR